MRIEHRLSKRFLQRRAVEVLVVGAGGTGSAILMGLPYLHQAIWCGDTLTGSTSPSWTRTPSPPPIASVSPSRPLT
jgi:hypothetical protein